MRERGDARPPPRASCCQCHRTAREKFRWTAAPWIANRSRCAIALCDLGAYADAAHRGELAATKCCTCWYGTAFGCATRDRPTPTLLDAPRTAAVRISDTSLAG